MSTAAPGLSVALCTYNGARFLSEQLASIATQTLKPDELVVCDDHSTDETEAIVRRFAESAPFEVRLHRQETNLGWRGNREDCYRKCRSAVIAVCDQDDVWKPEKLSLLSQALESQPECKLVFCNGQVVDENLNDLGYTSWAINSLNESRQRKIQEGHSLEALLPNTPVADATMMFRVSLLKTALPLASQWEPDEWMAILAAATGGCAIVPRALQLYRQHGTNLQGGTRRGFLEKYRGAKKLTSADYFANQEKRYATLLDRLRLHPGASDESAMKLIERRMRFAGARRAMRQRPWSRPWLIVRELARGNYHSMGTGMRTLMLDVCV